MRQVRPPKQNQTARISLHSYNCQRATDNIADLRLCFDASRIPLPVFSAALRASPAPSAAVKGYLGIRPQSRKPKKACSATFS